MTTEFICDHKDDAPYCVGCNHASRHLPKKANCCDQLCTEWATVCFNRRAKCLCVEAPEE